MQSRINFYKGRLHFYCQNITQKQEFQENLKDQSFSTNSDRNNINLFTNDLNNQDSQTIHKENKSQPTQAVKLLAKKLNLNLEKNNHPKSQTNLREKSIKALSGYVMSIYENKRFQGEQFVSKTLSKNVDQIQVKNFKLSQRCNRFYKNQKFKSENKEAKPKSKISEQLSKSFGIFHEKVMLVSPLNQRSQRTDDNRLISRTIDLPRIQTSFSRDHIYKKPLLKNQITSSQVQNLEGWTPRIQEEQIIVDYTPCDDSNRLQQKRRRKFKSRFTKSFPH